MENNKTFTQEEVNQIVQDRLAKEKARYDKILADKDAEHTKQMRKHTAKEELHKRGIPAELIDLVRLDDDESCNQSLALLERNYKPKAEVSGPVVSGRSPENIGKTTPARMDSGDKSIRKAMGL